MAELGLEESILEGGEVGVMGEDGDVVCCCLWGRLCTSLAQCRLRVEPWAQTL